MPKPITRPYSRYSLEAVELLGKLIRRNRIDRKITAQDLSTRAGISRDLLWRIEKGDETCSIGAVFEAAAIVGVPLFDHDQSALTDRLVQTTRYAGLLPKSVRRPVKAVRDDF